MLPLADWLEAHATRTPEQRALIFEDTVYSYAALAARSARLAAWLQHERGLAPGARLAWLGFNTPDLVALLFACARIGVVLVPLNWRLCDQELAAIVADARVVLAVVDGSCSARATALAGVPQVVARHQRHGVAQLPDDQAAGESVTSFAAPERGVLLVRDLQNSKPQQRRDPSVLKCWALYGYLGEH